MSEADTQRSRRIARWLAVGFVATIVALPAVLYVTLRAANARQLQQHGQEITAAASSIRTFYTTNVVDRVLAADGAVVVTDDYRAVHGGIPIPATFSIEIGSLFGIAHGDGDEAEFTYAFVSDYPFAQRARDPLDAFEREALAFFRATLDQASASGDGYGAETRPTFEATSNPLVGMQVHRHATPVVMLSACVQCHNSHPDSPKRDWKVGDVRGIEVVTVASASLSGAADFRLLVPYVALVGLFAVGTVNAFRRTAIRLEDLNADLERTRASEATAARQLAVQVDQLALLAAVADGSVFGITIADASAPDHPLVYANDAFLALTGYERHEVIGSNCRFMRGPETDPEASARIRAAIERGTSTTVELLNYRRDGTTFWNRFTLFPVRSASGAVTYYVGYQVDVSAQRAADVERQLMLSEIREVQKHESLGMLVAGVAHEINNPLGIALTAASYAGSSLDAVTTRLQERGQLDAVLREELEDEREAFRLVRENLERAAGLVRSFREIASDRAQSSRRVVDLREYLRAIVATFSPMLRRAEVTLSLEAPEHVEVEIDTGAFNQLVTNLVVNAVTHAFDGVTDPQIRLSVVTPSEDTVRIDVSDNGCGVPTSAQRHLFEPFYTTRRGQGGTGLGLYIARSIAQQSLSGDLRLEPSALPGATFVLTFPRRPEVAT